ncbi:glutamine amidotransferase class-I [Xylariales sp. PMI_506]|nr:glutamine amidotransferase class-I [Xylariales sp. PMI_506]
MGSLTTSDTRPIRLAILEADTPVPGARAKYGGYGGVFTHLFTRACAALDPPQPLESQLALSAHDIVNDLSSYPDPETLDAVLITGSKHNSFENHEWILRLVEYTKALLDGGRVRVIGVCFGHQIIGRAMGIEVGRSTLGWELSVTEMSLTEEGKKIFGKDTLRIQQMHRDVVFAHPPGTIPLAHTDRCATQGMYIPKRMIAVQGHPEFTEGIVTEILGMRHKDGIFNDEMYTDAMNRVGKDHDGVLIAQAFLRFLRE